MKTTLPESRCAPRRPRSANESGRFPRRTALGGTSGATAGAGVLGYLGAVLSDQRFGEATWGWGGGSREPREEAGLRQRRGIGVARAGPPPGVRPQSLMAAATRRDLAQVGADTGLARRKLSPEGAAPRVRHGEALVSAAAFLSVSVMGRGEVTGPELES